MIRARLRLFGEPTLTAGPDLHTTPVSLSSAPLQLLLAYLALHPNQPIDRRSLAFSLWPDTTDAAALRHLRQHLHRLRQILASLQLPDNILAGQGRQLYFTPTPMLWIDVEQFQRQIADRRRQIEAIELYRGDLLGRQQPAAPDYVADWLAPLRSKFREAYEAALRAQISIANMQRNYPRALYYARRLIESGPLREGSHRIFMEALYFNGERVQALQYFTQLERRLRRELNAAPMPQTTALYCQMQSGALPAEASLPVLPARQPPPALRPAVPSGESFVGRRECLSTLDESLAGALNGWGRLALVQGESGAGKTYLLQTWRQSRAGLMLAFSGQCLAEETASPLAPVTLALRRGLAQIDWERFPAHSPWENRLRQFLSSPVAAETAPPLSPDLLGQFILALAEHSIRPVCLLLDDLHHAGDALWQVLVFLARRCGNTPLLIVGAYQPDLPLPAARRVAQSLRQQRHISVIDLPPLSPVETAQLAAAILKRETLEKTFLNRLYRATEGNPFFITEFLKAAQTDSDLNLQTPPKTVRAAINARLSRLSPSSKALFDRAAVIGHIFPVKLLFSLAPEYHEQEILAALESWLDKGLVIEVTGGYQFAHEQIRLTTCAGLEPACRDQIHRQIADALAAFPPELLPDGPALLTFHRQKALEAGLPRLN